LIRYGWFLREVDTPDGLTRSVGAILKTAAKIFLLLICPPLYLFKEEDKLYYLKNQLLINI
jgi:hypothetical protein